MIKFFSCVLIYIVIAFGLYGYNHANGIFTHTHKDGTQCSIHNTSTAVFWPIAYPIYGIYQAVSAVGNFSISLFKPAQAERNPRHE